MKLTMAVSAPESRNMTTLFPEEIIDPIVGQSRVSAGVVLNEGMKARSAIPEDWKSAAQFCMSIPSELVNRIVKTSDLVG
jgi:hypothetical protein